MNKIIIGEKTYLQHPVLKRFVVEDKPDAPIEIIYTFLPNGFMLEDNAYKFEDPKTNEYYSIPKITWECYNGILQEGYKIVDTDGPNFFCDIKYLKKKKINIK